MSIFVFLGGREQNQLGEEKNSKMLVQNYFIKTPQYYSNTIILSITPSYYYYHKITLHTQKHYNTLNISKRTINQQI